MCLQLTTGPPNRSSSGSTLTTAAALEESREISMNRECSWTRSDDDESRRRRNRSSNERSVATASEHRAKRQRVRTTVTSVANLKQVYVIESVTGDRSQSLGALGLCRDSSERSRAANRDPRGCLRPSTTIEYRFPYAIYTIQWHVLF